MTYNEYKEASKKTATYPNKYAKVYLDLGMRGEAGEVCDAIKKLIRDCHWELGMQIPKEKRTDIALELGDVLWYAARKSDETDEPMHYIYSYTRKNGDDEELPRFKRPFWNTAHLAYAAKDLSDSIPEQSINWIVDCIEECAASIGYGLDEIAQMNIEKLQSRLERGKIQGSGDHR